MRATILIAAALLSGCAGHMAESTTDENGIRTERIYHNAGGFVGDELAAWKARGAHRYVVDGGCASFCAFVALSLPGSCYTRNARMSFHPVARMGMIEDADTRRLTAQLVSGMPDGLQRWWHATRPGTIGVDLVYDDLRRIIPDMRCKT